VADSGDADAELRVVDGVDDAVIPNADSPFLPTTLQLLASGRARFGAKRLQLWEYSFDQVCGKLVQLLLCAGL